MMTAMLRGHMSMVTQNDPEGYSPKGKARGHWVTSLEL